MAGSSSTGKGHKGRQHNHNQQTGKYLRQRKRTFENKRKRILHSNGPEAAKAWVSANL